jgi:phosphoserine aminotransferase
MNIPKNYQVLFLPGGATAQFAMVPINLLETNQNADYIDTGVWSQKAILEAKRYGTINVAATSEKKDGLTVIPPQDKWKLTSDAVYVHYTPNETIDGVEFKWIPDTGDIPKVVDMSSMILSRPMDVSQFGIIYAGAQKNMGQAGITVIIVREDLIKEVPSWVPTLYQYKIEADNHSFYNTPPTFSWYISGLVFAWLKRQGGLAKIYEINQRKAKKLYNYIDEHQGFYKNSIHPDCRSLTNIPFSLQKDKLTDTFLAESAKAGLTNLKGHRLAGGCRASLYNAMPEEGVDKLLEFMHDFARKHG